MSLLLANSINPLDNIGCKCTNSAFTSILLHLSHPCLYMLPDRFWAMKHHTAGIWWACSNIHIPLCFDTIKGQKSPSIPVSLCKKSKDTCRSVVAHKMWMWWLSFAKLNFSHSSFLPHMAFKSQNAGSSIIPITARAHSFQTCWLSYTILSGLFRSSTYSIVSKTFCPTITTSPTIISIYRLGPLFWWWLIAPQNPPFSSCPNFCLQLRAANFPNYKKNFCILSSLTCAILLAHNFSYPQCPYPLTTMVFRHVGRLSEAHFCSNSCLQVSTSDESTTSLSTEAPIFAPSSQVDCLVHSTFTALTQYSINGQPHPARLGATHSPVWAVLRHLTWKCSWQWTDSVIHRRLFSSTSWFAQSSHM